MTQIQRFEGSLLPAPDMLAAMLEMSNALYQSGLLPPHIKSPQAAFAVIQKGRELGIPPMYSMSNITVISGKPTTSAELMLALIYRDHGDVAIQFEDTTNERCTISYARRSWPTRKTYSFTLQDAKQAGVTGNQTWQKYPAAMLRARCISAVARLAFPDSIAGMYTPEELGAQVDMSSEGDITIVEVAAQPPNVDKATGEMLPPQSSRRQRLIAKIEQRTADARDTGVDYPPAPNFDTASDKELEDFGLLIKQRMDEQSAFLAVNLTARSTTPEGIKF